MTWEGWRERLPADLETCTGRVKSGALLSAAVGGRISQGGETGLLVSLGHWGSQHRRSGGLASPDLPSTVASWKGPWAVSSVLLERSSLMSGVSAALLGEEGLG